MDKNECRKRRPDLEGTTSVRPIKIVPHLRSSKIVYRFRSCRDPQEKMRWQVIWLMTRPGQARSAHAVSHLVGVSPEWAVEIVKRWNAHGPEGLRDGRHRNGNKPLLNDRRRAALVTALQGPAPDGGLWTGPKVARYVEQQWNIRVNPATGWKWLKRLGFSLQVPRPSHPRSATPAQRRSWKRCLTEARAGPAPQASE